HGRLQQCRPGRQGRPFGSHQGGPS
ncbi:hypothetical protein BN1723_020703, partial [Verticillium longisporum]